MGGARRASGAGTRQPAEMARRVDALPTRGRSGSTGQLPTAAGGRHGSGQDLAGRRRIADSPGDGRSRSCLVAAPAGLLDQWRREIEKWAPELSAIIIRGSTSDRSWQWAAPRDVILVSYDTLRSDFNGNAQSPVRRRNWDVVVADEAQRIKNRNDTSNALKGLRRTRSWALTGTPIENHEEELASILEFVDHDGSKPPKRYRSGAELLQRHSRVATSTQKERRLGRPSSQAGNQGNHRPQPQAAKQLPQGRTGRNRLP